MRKLLCAVMIISVLFAACACTDTAAPAEPPVITDEDLYGVDVEEEKWPVITGSAAFLPYYTAAAARMLEISEEEASRYVLCSTSDFAYADLIDDRADLIFAFLPDQEQAAMADREGVTLACYPVLNEAFVFFVSQDNPVDGLTLEQIRGIYTGQITNWKEVGGDDEAILPFRRSPGSSGHNGLLQFVAPENELVSPPMEERPGTMEETAEVPANYDNSPGALGCGYRHAVEQQYGDMKLKLLKIDGVEPSAENVQNRVYPMISQACAIIRGGEEETEAGRLAQWCAWPLGQALAKQMGYEPNMPVEEQSVPAAADREAEEPAGGWAEGRAVPSGSGRTLRRNGLSVETAVLEDGPDLYASCVSVSGLKDKTVEAQINARIRSVVDAFCSKDFLPDTQGIQTYVTAGLTAQDCRYRTVTAQVMANAENMLSVLVTCEAAYDLPAKGRMVPQSLFFDVCEPLNLDLSTGKDIPVTALVSDDVKALPFLDGLVEQYVQRNADTVYRDEDDFGTLEGAASVSVRVTSLPELKQDQKYYLDASSGTLYLILDVRTPWAVTGTDFSCLPLDLGAHAAFTRFRTEESLFE